MIAGFVVLALALVARSEANSPKPVTSADKVKASASATKPDADGKQTVTITLEIQQDWELYANPVNHNNEFLDVNCTSVKISAKEPIKVSVKYPVGKTRTELKEKFDVYEGKVKISAEIVRSKGDASPLLLDLFVFASDVKGHICIHPGRIKLTVP